MEPAKSFEHLIVWQKAHEFVLGVYRLTERFPESELYGLTSQLRRAAVSVPANVAEGFKKAGKADKLRFMNTAQGSLEECRYYLILGRDLEYAETNLLRSQLDEVCKLLQGYSSGIRRRMMAAAAGIVLAAGLTSYAFSSFLTPFS